MSRSRSELLTWAGVVIVAVLSGCEPGTCVRESDCVGPTVCRVGRCVIADDAGPVPDAPAFDTGDANTDAAVLDAGSDAAIDAPLASDASTADAPMDDAAMDDAPMEDAGVADAGVSLDSGAADAPVEDGGA